MFILIFITGLMAQPNIQWQKCFGGTFEEYANSIQQTTDGGYIVAGLTFSNDSDVSGNNGAYDYWVVKLTSIGSIQWQKCFGGNSHDLAYSIRQTSDGGFIVAGKALSSDSNLAGNHGNDDFWVIKLTPTGSIQWQKCLGGSGEDDAQSIQQTVDGGFIVVGYTYSNDSDVSGNHGYYDYWIVKLSSSGSIQWQKCLGGSDDDEAQAIQQTSDTGYIVAGFCSSNDGDVSGNHGNKDFWVVKLNATGSIQWQKCLGGSDDDEAKSIQQTSDGGYIVAGDTYSNDSDVSGNNGNRDFWIVKLAASGTIQWQKCLGGSEFEYAKSIKQTTDGGYIVAGVTPSNDSDVTFNHGGGDLWVVKLTPASSIQWQKCFGGSGEDGAQEIQQTTDGGYIVAGNTFSNDGDVSGNHGNRDFWVVKLGPFVGIEEVNNFLSAITITPNPITQSAIISFSLFQKRKITINVYDIAGRLIKTLLHSEFEMGLHSLTWDGSDYKGKSVENGIYLLCISTENRTETKMIEFVKKL